MAASLTSSARDPVVDKFEQPVLNTENALKIALFGINLRGGVTLADVEGKAEGTWEENLRLARHADRIGLDAVIPIARWRGYGGRGNLGDRSFETFTWATGLLASTRRIQVFATFHVPVAHPVLAAKMVATADHVSGGRFGLNIVAGWYPQEFSMFGLTQKDHDERYEVADEWTQVLKQLWTTVGDHDYHGRYFDVPEGTLEPKPLQKPYPVIMNAGTSPAGRAFAAKHSDLIFGGLTSFETPERVAGLKQLAREQFDREIRVFGRCHVVCRDSDAEAEEYYDYVHRRQADIAGARNVTSISIAQSQSTDWESAEMRRIIEGCVAGFWAVPIIGSPDTVAEKMLDLHRAGADGLALSFVNYDEGLRQMEELILPRLIAAGSRRALA